MKKLVSAAIVGAAGIALIVGGAGSFALWNKTATVNAGAVSAGVLSIAPSGTSSWSDVSTATAKPIASIADFKMVPGDTVQFSQVVTVNATGNNLSANLTFDNATIVATTASDIALKAATVYSLVASGTGVTASGVGNGFTVAPTATGTSQVTLTFKANLPSNTADSTAQGGSVNLSGLNFSLVQNVR
jgi:alternate signal-mediated exported protein